MRSFIETLFKTFIGILLFAIAMRGYVKIFYRNASELDVSIMAGRVLAGLFSCCVAYVFLIYHLVDLSKVDFYYRMMIYTVLVILVIGIFLDFLFTGVLKNKTTSPPPQRKFSRRQRSANL